MVSKSSVSHKKKHADYESVGEADSLIDSLRNVLRYRKKDLLQKSVLEIITEIENEVNPRMGDGINYLPVKEDLRQIVEAKTLARASYYVRRLIKSLSGTKTNGINDINLYRWKEYDEVLTDSLWTFERRDTSGAHLGWYWGNFVPQIPHQLLLRYTKRGDWILDPFAGSGTTLIECNRLGRNGIGVEINEDIVKKATELIAKEPNKYGTRSVLAIGDSTRIDFNGLCKRNHISRVQLVIVHPPYFDIIKFSDHSEDLSNARSVEKFLEKFGRVVRRVSSVLQDRRYLVLVAGDKYQNGEWIPLGFNMMEEVMKNGFKLTGIIAKNFEDTRAKRNQKELWRYRALAGGFYVFKHEYIFIFKKQKERESGADRV